MKQFIIGKLWYAFASIMFFILPFEWAVRSTCWVWGKTLGKKGDR